jgi:hypothetical protein
MPDPHLPEGAPTFEVVEQLLFANLCSTWLWCTVAALALGAAVFLLRAPGMTDAIRSAAESAVYATVAFVCGGVCAAAHSPFRTLSKADLAVIATTPFQCAEAVVRFNGAIQAAGRARCGFALDLALAERGFHRDSAGRKSAQPVGSQHAVTRCPKPTHS